MALLMVVAAYGQSVADLARANREKQDAANASAKPPAQFTNDNLPKDPLGDDVPAPAPARAAASNKVHTGSHPQQPVDERAAAQWKSRILAQKDKVTSLQARIDQLNATIHPAGSAQFEGPSSRNQARQQQRVAEVQLQLDEQKKKLAEMQEEARRAGMHTAVYDP